MPMQAQVHAPADSDALSPALKRAGEPQRRQAVTRSVQDRRRDVSESDHPEIKQDASTFYNRGGVVVVASAWLAFYLVVVICRFIVSGN